MTRKRIPIVAIVGRTNVGKSTLFNALAGRKLSIVEDQPGVTRDRHYALVTRFAFPFTLIDTGGLVGEEETGLAKAVREQAVIAIEESDMVLAVFDGVEGPQQLDEEVVELLRRSDKPVLWIINKCEKPSTQAATPEFYSLGVEGFHYISAANSIGIGDIVSTIGDELEIGEGGISTDESEAEDDSIRVAIVGKPNVGKSSLINRILGENRLVAAELAGTTRDSIDIELTRDGQRYVIVDTAGLRKKRKVDDATVERYSNLHALKALASCDVAVLILDATDSAPTEQDQKIASLIHERGRAFVVVVNKWDAIEKDHRAVKTYEEVVRKAFRFAPYVPVLFVSAMSGRRCPSILKKAKEVYETARTRVKTAQLNKTLGAIFDRKPPPAHHGGPVRLLFATQVSVAPPELVIFVNNASKIPSSYERYVRNSFRKEFPFEGTDIKITFRKKTETASRKGR